MRTALFLAGALLSFSGQAFGADLWPNYGFPAATLALPGFPLGYGSIQRIPSTVMLCPSTDGSNTVAACSFGTGGSSTATPTTAPGTASGQLVGVQGAPGGLAVGVSQSGTWTLTLANGSHVALDAGGNVIGAVTQSGGPWSTTDSADVPNSGGASVYYASQVAGIYRATKPTISDAGANALRETQDGALAVQQQPTALASASIAPIASATLEGSHVFKASAGNLYSYSVTTAGTAGYVLVFDSATVPADGAVTPKRCSPVAANTEFTRSPPLVPEGFASGISMAFSTTGCFSKTTSATAFFSADFQ